MRKTYEWILTELCVKNCEKLSEAMGEAELVEVAHLRVETGAAVT